MDGYVEAVADRGRADPRLAASPFWRAVLLAALPAAAVVLTACHYSLTEVWWLASGDRMASFEAAAPFQYRVLLPLVVAALHALTSVNVFTLFVLTELAAWMALVLVADRALRAFGIATGDLARRALAMTVMVPVGVQLIIPDLRIHSLLAADGSLDFAQWHLTALFRYVYDLPAAVFTLGLVLVLRRVVVTLDSRWLAAYLGLFTLAALNRETTMFLVPVFFAVCWRVLDHRTLAGALLIQLVVLLVIQSGLQWLFAENTNPHANVPGTEYENHLRHNLGLLSQPTYLATFLLRFGAGLYLPVLLLHRYLDPFLARTLLCFGVPFLVSTLVFGRIQEHRVMVEVVPLLWLGAVQAMAAYTAHRAGRLSPDGDIRGRVGASARIGARRAG